MIGNCMHGVAGYLLLSSRKLLGEIVESEDDTLIIKAHFRRREQESAFSLLFGHEGASDMSVREPSARDYDVVGAYFDSPGLRENDYRHEEGGGIFTEQLADGTQVRFILKNRVIERL